MAPYGIAGAVLFCLAAGAAERPAADLDDGLVLHLTMVVGEDRALTARVGPSARGTVPPVLQDGALLCGVPAAEVVVEDTAALLGATDALTLSAWVAPGRDISSYRSLLYKGQRAGPDAQRVHYNLCLIDGRVEFKFHDDGGHWQGILRNAEHFLVPGGEPVLRADLPAVQPGRWNHVAATFDHGEVRTFLDGKPVLAGRGAAAHLLGGPEPLRLGSGQDAGGRRAYAFAGLLDDVRVYRRALASDEIASLYTVERPAKPTGRVAVREPLPPGYDPELKTALRLLAAASPAPTAVHELPAAANVVLRQHHGAVVPYLNDLPVYPMAMMPCPYVRDTEVTLSCRDFAAAGVDIYSEILWSWAEGGDGCKGWWTGPGEYDFAMIDRRLAAIVAANPAARLLPRVKLNPPRWWLAAHPDEISTHDDGSKADQASLASPLWEETYERMLRDLIRHLETGPYARHIIGYHPAGGGSSEWFWWSKDGKFIDYSPAARERFRGWLRDAYQGDTAALRIAWQQPGVSFDAAAPPTAAARRTSEAGFFREPRAARQVTDYRRFLSAMVAHNITRSCRIVKEETGGRKLAGVFYGYSLYTVGGLPNDGFQGLGEVLASPDVDFLASPTSYGSRRGGDPGCFVSAYSGSYRLHGKLYWDEVDTRTHLYPQDIGYRTATVEETLAVHRRAVGWSLTKGTGLWWFLLAGNATFHQDAIMEDISLLRAAVGRALVADRATTAQVAVFADEESMHFTNTNSAFHGALLRETLEELARMGAPSDTYRLDDIADPRLPDYRLYLFLNAFYTDPARRRAIAAAVRQRGRVAVWVYAPGYIADEGFDEAAMLELTGLTLRHADQPARVRLEVTASAHPITRACPSAGPSYEIGPRFWSDDPQAVVLGTVGGHPGLVLREFAEWRSVYSALPLRRELLLGLCRYAGVHLYSESFDVCGANRSYVMLHTTTPGRKIIHLPRKCTISDAVRQDRVAVGTDTVALDLPAGATWLLRLE